MSGRGDEPRWDGPPPPRPGARWARPANGGHAATPAGQPAPPLWGGEQPPQWGGQPASQWGGQPASQWGGPQPPPWGGQPASQWGGQQAGWGGQPWQAPAARRGVPVWAVVLVGVLALVIGLGVGGAVGFVAGMGSQFAEDLSTPSVGPDAQRGGGPLSASHEVGDLTVESVVVERDFAGDFEAQATVTNRGADTYAGGAMEFRLLEGAEVRGTVSGYVPPLGPGQTEVVPLWGFDRYVEGVDTVEILAD